MLPSKIRNFSIIAHIDHGKSTLADRLLLNSGAITAREFREQILDDMDLERERGITIKARAVRIHYKDHWLNLIDTPGHIDFTYEVSKSLAACEGVLLLVDAGQGIQAQTVTNLYLAMERNLTIIPVVTKIDLPTAEPEKVRKEVAQFLNVDEQTVILSSAKSGEGAESILDAIIDRIPAPQGDPEKPLKALIFDSKYDTYQGVITYFRVMEGTLRTHDQVLMMQTGTQQEALEIGIFSPKPEAVEALGVGAVGYMTANIKEVAEVKIGDTLTLAAAPALEPLPGYQEIKPMVFCGLYPINAKDFPLLRVALSKLRLNDSSFVYEPETSASLGFGYRCGFLGLLHMDIVKERLEREFNLELIITAPSVVYQILTKKGEIIELDNPTKLPHPTMMETIDEPYILARLMVPTDTLGAVMQLCQDRRGIYKSTEYLDPTRAVLTYEIPFSEVVMDFYDKIKSMTAGYGSLNYEFIGHKPSELVKLDVLINGEPVDALSSITCKEKAYQRGRSLVEKLKEVIPRQMFEVVIQAAVGSKIIARDSISAMKKNVTAKCYGGDITRKRKLWERQKEGKKRMKKIGRVDLPQEAFISVLKVE
ncbi:MAG: Elongation factor 4 [Candidatus Omnitrophica bacterium ADurb.Bin292]|jgi:GTP-binding protein LepA|nr:MAG: Elongation factor 4 [Candidatus Omnitrophica bacterium ADurb.Bin292]HOG24131.1 translation elongation factor 4 [Candidatus Omnitrophota bacterium]HPW76397.1 translation elongation factor 4 [Candidatus Omnitrophota bacterium]HQB11982.1 translation elongation factor 4 [Candidatus Omnitrophota bacterium]